LPFSGGKIGPFFLNRRPPRASGKASRQKADSGWLDSRLGSAQPLAKAAPRLPACDEDPGTTGEGACPTFSWRLPPGESTHKFWSGAALSPPLKGDLGGCNSWAASKHPPVPPVAGPSPFKGGLMAEHALWPCVKPFALSWLLGSTNPGIFRYPCFLQVGIFDAITLETGASPPWRSAANRCQWRYGTRSDGASIVVLFATHHTRTRTSGPR
jgi:hypothetical protein